MKSLEDLYKEVQENEELKKAFISAFKEGRVEEFLTSRDCDASAADVMTFLNSTKEEIASEDDLATVAGGDCTSIICSGSCAVDNVNQGLC